MLVKYLTNIVQLHEYYSYARYKRVMHKVLYIIMCVVQVLFKVLGLQDNLQCQLDIAILHAHVGEFVGMCRLLNRRCMHDECKFLSLIHLSLVGVLVVP